MSKLKAIQDAIREIRKYTFIPAHRKEVVTSIIHPEQVLVVDWNLPPMKLEDYNF
jgi:hypothetical protein